MESSKAGVIKDFSKSKEPEIPFMHEVWNWEGDKSVLPSKWVAIIQHSRGSSPTAKQLLEKYINTPKFDPNSFFFITKRSKAIGCAIVTDASGKYCIEYLGTASKERESIEGALLDLCAQYAKKASIKELHLEAHEYICNVATYKRA